MIEPPAAVPPGVSPKNADPAKVEVPIAPRLTATDLEKYDVSKMRCIGCLSYGSCNNKQIISPDNGTPILLCAQRKAIYAQENGLTLPF